MSGPPVQVSARSVVMLSMVLHELATNASKYGALSTPNGRVIVDWLIKPVDRVELYWRESGGPAVEKPQRSGFGSTLIEKGFPAQIGGSALLQFDANGLRCTLEFPPR